MPARFPKDAKGSAFGRARVGTWTPRPGAIFSPRTVDAPRECRSLACAVGQACRCSVKMGTNGQWVRLYGMLHHSAGRLRERHVLLQVRRMLSRLQWPGVV